jgi:hypothetical protein
MRALLLVSDKVVVQFSNDSPVTETLYSGDSTNPSDLALHLMMLPTLLVRVMKIKKEMGVVMYITKSGKKLSTRKRCIELIEIEGNITEYT